MTRAPSLADLLAIVAVARLMRQVDLVVAHSSKAGAVARLSRFVFRVRRPLVFIPHGWSWLNGGRQAAAYRVFERWASRRTSTIVCVSSTEADEGRRVLGSRAPLHVIENGVDMDALDASGPAADRTKDPLLVVVGRLARQKGQDIAIRALAEMSHPDARLRLVGEGPEGTRLRVLAGSLGVADRVEFVGRTDALPHLRAADVVVVPSRWEGLSLTLLESMGLGCAVVASPGGSAAALAESGRIVNGDSDPEVARELARACDELLADPQLRRDLGKSARERARVRHSLDRVKADHARLWDGLTEVTGGTVNQLWLEATYSGSAAEMHLSGTQQRVLAAGRSIGLVMTDSHDAPRTTVQRLRRIGRLIVRGIGHARSETLLVRHHPLAAPVVWAWRLRGASIVIAVQGPLTNARADGGFWARVLPVDALGLWQLRRANALVTVTQGLVEQLIAVTDDKVPVWLIPNGIEDPGAVEPIVRERAYACFAGNLASWQGIDLMLAAVDCEQWPGEVDLVVVGDGALRDRVSESRSERVIYRGRLPQAETRRWLAGSLCAFSLQDPDDPAGSGGYWPFKVLESAALGVPVVLSDAPGLPEMADKLGHALICGYDDPQGAAAAVASLARDAGLRTRLADTGRARVMAYGWEAGSKQLAELLQVAEQSVSRRRRGPARHGASSGG